MNKIIFIALLLLLLKGKAWATPTKGLAFERFFERETVRFNLPKGLLSRVAKQESNYNPNVSGRDGEIGLMQFMPATAQDMGINPAIPEEAAQEDVLCRRSSQASRMRVMS